MGWGGEEEGCRGETNLLKLMNTSLVPRSTVLRLQ